LIKSTVMKTIYVVANKNWEVEPLIAAMVSSEIRPLRLLFLSTLNSQHAGIAYISNQPRAIIEFKDINGCVSLQVYVWCIQDLMSSDPAVSTSSSQEKYRVLPSIFKLPDIKPDFVIAMGTAGFLNQILDGSVVIGSEFFIHNGHPDNPKSHLESNLFGQLLNSNVNPSLFSIFSNDFRNQVEPKFIPVPNNTPAKSVCISAPVYVALSSVNVTDYNEYNWVDNEAIQEYNSTKAKHPIGSVETTHGVIKLCTNLPIIFVSAITDCEGRFNIDVTPTQNYVPAFNAGIVLGQFLVNLNDYIIQNPAFNFNMP